MPRKRKRRDALVYRPRKKSIEYPRCNDKTDDITVCDNVCTSTLYTCNDHNYYACNDPAEHDNANNSVDFQNVSSSSGCASARDTNHDQGEVNLSSANITEHFTPDIVCDESAIDELCVVGDVECYTSVALSEEVSSSSVQGRNFQHFKEEVKNSLTKPFVLHPSAANIQIVELCPADEQSCVKWMIIINQDYNANIFVHRKQISSEHEFWIGLPKTFNKLSAISELLSKLSSFSVCIGNCDVEFQDLVPIGGAIEHNDDSSNTGYREGDFCAIKGDVLYHSTLRSSSCKLLLNGARCGSCSKFRTVLRSRKIRQEEKKRKSENSTPNFMSKRIKHCNMSQQELIGKITQQKTHISNLEKEIGQLKRRFQREISNKGVSFNSIQHHEMTELMSACRDEMETAYPLENCYQRLFWQEQLKQAKLKSSCGMRWHPMIIKWCLYLRHKSSATYEALRDSGFIKLPSARTLFDYSHYIKSALGFQPDVVQVLKSEADKKGMYREKWKCYVGLLFDEIKVKSDLVYDKHTGELIGFCNLDKVGNEMLNFEKHHKHSENDSDLAKFMLVLMVRGTATDLRFPLAGFATNSVTADFLYPIMWKACRILEVTVKLKVLFFTCDGASANRKFFNMHSIDEGEEFVYYTVNPHDKSRRIYFISDVPHLVKTTRNCFANSFAHKNTRKLWNNGRDISWLHILKLYEDHCENEIYTPCPKLSRAHVDLTAFSYMKVNLAAQVLSSTVSNALEVLYGDNVSETVKFIRTMDKFFDCLNVRNLFEGRNKRNPNLEAYSSVDDVRLNWLLEDFLNYFKDWEQSVENREGEFSKTQKNGMMLSLQTLQGLRKSAHAIVQCVKFLLDEGVSFVLTNVFNQDPLEQHFGHYRYRGGDNCSPTVYDVRNTMTQMRAIGAQALPPSVETVKEMMTGMM